MPERDLTLGIRAEWLVPINGAESGYWTQEHGWCYVYSSENSCSSHMPSCRKIDPEHRGIIIHDVGFSVSNTQPTSETGI